MLVRIKNSVIVGRSSNAYSYGVLSLYLCTFSTLLSRSL